MMKNSWLLIPLIFSVASCKKSEPDIPPQTEVPSKSSTPKPTPLEPVADQASIPKQQENSAAEAPTSPPKETAAAPHSPAPKQPSARPAYPVATAVEGQKGYVKSPHSGQIIDVRDMPSGTLVQDPTFPAEEKKYFRVP